MPWLSQVGPSEKQKCVAGCGRYRQSQKTKMCRQCEKESGIIDSLNTQLRRELLEQAAAAEKQLERQAPKPTRELVIGNTVYEVVWDGSK